MDALKVILVENETIPTSKELVHKVESIPVNSVWTTAGGKEDPVYSILRKEFRSWLEKAQ